MGLDYEAVESKWGGERILDKRVHQFGSTKICYPVAGLSANLLTFLEV